MTLAALRRSARSVAMCLLLVSIWGLPHRVEGDDACPPAGAEQHDESKHVFSSGALGDHAEHCAICHWLRSVKSDLAQRATGTPQPDRTACVAAAMHRSACDGIPNRLPARAPPALAN